MKSDEIGREQRADSIWEMLIWICAPSSKRDLAHQLRRSLQLLPCTQLLLIPSHRDHFENLTLRYRRIVPPDLH